MKRIFMDRCSFRKAAAVERHGDDEPYISP